MTAPTRCARRPPRGLGGSLRSGRALAAWAAWRAFALVAPFALAVASPCAGQDVAVTPTPAPAAVVDAGAARAAAVAAAASALRADPELSGKHTVHVRRWNDSEDEPEKPKKPGKTDSSWADALADISRFLSDTSRLLVYGVGLVLAVLLLVSLRHVVQLRELNRRVTARRVVSHVRDLDVRPESLPDDVGAAAWALWQAGRVAEALSLLYRAALSRLIHRFEVPIDSSTTEGESLELARRRVDADALRYLTQLVRAREASTYGGRTLSAAMGEALCGAFARRLDAQPAPAEAAS